LAWVSSIEFGWQGGPSTPCKLVWIRTRAQTDALYDETKTSGGREAKHADAIASRISGLSARWKVCSTQFRGDRKD
jgi:hypothetical protein